LFQSVLFAPDLCRALGRRDGGVEPPNRKTIGSASTSGTRPWRRGRCTTRGPACDPDQPGHTASTGVEATSPWSCPADAEGSRDRRLGLEARSPLRHNAGEPRDERGRRSVT
jgi:hypothetical protein